VGRQVDHAVVEGGPGPVYERIVAAARPLGVINLLRRAYERG